MNKFLYEIDRMTPREYRNFILSLGGQISFFRSLLKGGTGLGGLYLMDGRNSWWDYPELVQTAAALEKMNRVLMIRMNNTKRNIAYPIPYTQIKKIVIKSRNNLKTNRLELELILSYENGPDVCLENRGWNNQAIIKFFNCPKLKNYLEMDAKLYSIIKV